MRRRLKIVLWMVVVAAGVMGLGLWGTYRAAKQVPTFYEHALRLEPERMDAAGEKLEAQVLTLHNDVQREGRWQAVITAEEINGWLAAELPKKFAKLLPSEAKEPRVAFRPGRLEVACRYESPKLATVVNCSFDVYLTDEPNVVAVRFRKVRAGAVPLPFKQVVDKISQAARDGDIRLRWQQAGGDPVALVSIPSEHEQYKHHHITIETLELREGELFLSGRTDPSPPGRTAQSPEAFESTGSNQTLQR